MRLRNLALVALAAVIASCSDHGLTGPLAGPVPLFDHNAAHPSVRLSEIHYDNAGTDAGEAIEISGPGGTDVTGWTIVLYNGSATSRATYAPLATLNGTIPTTCNGRGVTVQTYAVNGIQNGDPDGVALVNAGGQVVEFLSYGGSFVAANGPAAGMTSVDLGVKESSTTPLGFSLQRTATGTWSPQAANTFGTCNDDDSTPPGAVVVSVTIAPAAPAVTQGGTITFSATAFDAASAPISGVTFSWASDAAAVATIDAAGVATAVAPGDANITATAPNGVVGTTTLHVNPPAPPALPATRLVEIHYDNVGTDVFEAIEVEGPAGTDLTGWSVVLYNGNGGVQYTPRSLSGLIPSFCSGRGVVSLSYPQDGIQNGSPDGFALVDAAGQVVEFLSYEGTFTATDGPAIGLASKDIGVAESSSPIGQSLQRNAAGVWQGPATATIGGCNNGDGPPPPPAFAFTFTGRDPVADPALPVGFQDQLFVTVRDGSGATVTTPVAWSSDTPALASIDANGVVTALGEGSAVLRATTEDGLASATFALPTRIAIASLTALYAGNTEFGEPGDADPSDDIIVRRAQYTTSFNPLRGIPNWVSYDLDPTHFGTEDRCDCFTFDPALPASLTHYTTADYTGAGTFHGYGIDRGHLARSFDRTSASFDNATTFYFSNIVPQAADLNQGPWAAFESFLGDMARLQNKEVYIVTGASGSKGTIKNLGAITIPARTWKVAVILPHDQGLASIHSYQDLQVIAVNMPNDPGVRNVPWQTYLTTVDAVEALSGYDLLALLADQVEIAVESNTAPPTAAINGPFSSAEGSAVSLSGAGSTDPDGDVLSYAWTFGDGGSASGASVSHTWAQNGAYTVQLTVTDPLGLVSTTTTTATVSNVAPVIAAFAGATLLPGERYSASGSFTDPGADTWSATVNYGDGTGTSPLGLSGMTFSLAHVYTTAGTFTASVNVSDGDDVSTGSATVTVITPVQGIAAAQAIVQQLNAGGSLNNGNANSLQVKLSAASASLTAGQSGAAIDQLEALLNELDALVGSGRLSASDADALRVMVTRVIQSIPVA